MIVRRLPPNHTLIIIIIIINVENNHLSEDDFEARDFGYFGSEICHDKL